MSVIYLLIIAGILFSGAFLMAFLWAVRSGQYDDATTPAVRILLDEPALQAGEEEEQQQAHIQHKIIYEHFTRSEMED